MNISVVGLGYVGLPLAVALSRHFKCVGFDTSEHRVEELKGGHDANESVASERLINPALTFSSDIKSLKSSEVHIVTVPTPVNKLNQPDLTLIQSACEMVASVLKKGDIIVFESTVFPGCTEEFCVPIVEKTSGLKFNKDFYVGYSPERINPGDSDNTIDRVVKIVSASNERVLGVLETIYSKVTTAGVHLAPSIRVAEAAKVVENIQRDVNIALMNELEMLFSGLEIETSDVLKAAGTKWNFLNFQPGLVGGHCIAVDPYYLIHKANQINFDSRVIGAARAVSESMPEHYAKKIIVETLGNEPKGKSVLVLGITFKENVPDTRNSKVFDLIDVLAESGAQISVFDPMVSKLVVPRVRALQSFPEPNSYDAVVLAVPHKELVEKGLSLLANLSRNGQRGLFDLKGAFRL